MAKLGILLYTRGHPEPFSMSSACGGLITLPQGRDERFNPYVRNSEITFL